MKILQGSCVIIKVYQNSRLKVLIGIEEIIKILRLYIFTELVENKTDENIERLTRLVKYTLGFNQGSDQTLHLETSRSWISECYNIVRQELWRST